LQPERFGTATAVYKFAPEVNKRIKAGLTGHTGCITRHFFNYPNRWSGGTILAATQPDWANFSGNSARDGYKLARSSGRLRKYKLTMIVLLASIFWRFTKSPYISEEFLPL
jgi:hypothetical protein